MSSQSAAGRRSRAAGGGAGSRMYSAEDQALNMISKEVSTIRYHNMHCDFAVQQNTVLYIYHFFSMM